MTQPTPWPNPPQVPPHGPRAWPAQTSTSAPSTTRPPFTIGDDPDFPTAVDPALIDGYVEATAESCGLANDPIARILDLRARLDAEVAGLTAEQYRDLVQYGWPRTTAVAA